MSDFHIVVFFFILLYTNLSFFDETDTEQIQIQTSSRLSFGKAIKLAQGRHVQ